ncbi:lipopolysaccharide transport periplasmic protein LptA [Photobacterium sp. GJ3]|uniref:lipopolysaccharide transport periplasmic protein LptA n=1 Tax=Photobacterium sp. GJ3 TaxID=2829502 RepID=UPI001B8CE3A1|nr:lipopolysaccharide transport periplasmic protein LptA [Photobacterium sp. GJ3]QUJ67122.1 lipopolysaccharide transport periplasmic protein LptA [Photobacterium sp. GJ3]
MKLCKISALLCLIVSSSSWALSNDTEQPIYINSDSQELDIQKNVVTFTGNVTLRQGSIDIRADKVIVTRQTQNGDQQTIDAFGSPATFYQQMDDGKPINGSAMKMRYETATEFLKMTDKAVLIQEGSEIKGKTISYKIDEQKLVATSGDQQRVTTILQPNQLKQKQ